MSEYHKQILQRRISAYEQVEILIYVLKSAVFDDDDDDRPYHIVFTQDHPQRVLIELTTNIMAHSLWLSNAAFESTRKLSVLLFPMPKDKPEIIEFAKSNYALIARAREELENISATDMTAVERCDIHRH